MDTNTFEGHVPPPPPTISDSDSVFSEVKLRTMASDLKSLRESGGTVRSESLPLHFEPQTKKGGGEGKIVLDIIIVLIAIAALFFMGFKLLPSFFQ